MLPKVNRLKRKDFERVFKKGKGFKEDFLILKFNSNGLNQNRFGIVVSKKISKKATLRNKIKRRIGQLIKLKLGRLKKGIDIILITLPGLETKDFWEIGEVIDKLFQKSGLVK